MGFISKIKEAIVGKYLKSTVRHSVGLLGGVLLGIGLDPELVKEFIPAAQEIAVGSALFILAQVWSWFDKKSK